MCLSLIRLIYGGHGLQYITAYTTAYALSLPGDREWKQPHQSTPKHLQSDVKNAWISTM